MFLSNGVKVMAKNRNKTDKKEETKGNVIILPEKTETAKEAEKRLPVKKGEASTPEKTNKTDGAANNNAITESVKSEKEERREETKSDFPELYALSTLLNEEVGKVKEDCLFSGIKKFTSRLGKVVVRYNVTDGELYKLAVNSETLGLKETAVSPAYIPAVAKALKKSERDMCVSALIDFPFGENSFAAKMAGLKESVKLGVDEATVFMPAILVGKDNKKIFIKQLKKISRAFRKNAGAAFNATELKEEDVKTVTKAAEKAGLAHLLFAFGDVSESEAEEKFSAILKNRSDKVKVKILCNVKSADAVSKLYKSGAECVLTPFADEIGAELIERFGIKSVKLL